MSNGPIEPSAATRGFAAAMQQMYIALTQEGFTETQALTLIGHVLASSRGES